MHRDAFLARGRPLGQARLLWEIGRDGGDVRAAPGPAGPGLGLSQPALARIGARWARMVRLETKAEHWFEKGLPGRVPNEGRPVCSGSTQ
jgi:hypothetical protein